MHSTGPSWLAFLRSQYPKSIEKAGETERELQSKGEPTLVDARGE